MPYKRRCKQTELVSCDFSGYVLNIQQSVQIVLAVDRDVEQGFDCFSSFGVEFVQKLGCEIAEFNSISEGWDCKCVIKMLDGVGLTESYTFLDEGFDDSPKFGDSKLNVFIIHCQNVILQVP